MIGQSPPEESPSTEHSWTIKTFHQLTTTELYAVLQARQDVFIVEQNCPYSDADGIDEQCWHLCCWYENAGNKKLLAYLRIVPPGVKFREPSLGRIITTAAGRGQGLGRTLVQRGIEECQRLFPESSIRIAAQQYLERFYSTFGFVPASEPYLEDGIPHQDMVRKTWV
jgi:ElaA protein